MWENDDWNEDWNELTDDEVEERMDALVEAYQPYIEADESKTTMLNGARMRQLQFTYTVMRYLTRGTDAVVTYKLYEPFKTMGSVSVEGESIEFHNMGLFAKAAALASNVDIYQLTNNKIRLTFTFHGLTVPIED